MRTPSIRSELPSYTAATADHLPTYDEQWDEDEPLEPVRPMPAHFVGRDSFDAGPSLEADQPQAHSAMQYLSQTPAPAAPTRPAARRAQSTSCCGCCAGCTVLTGVLIVPGTIIAGGITMGASWNDGPNTAFWVGSGLAIFGLLLGATLHSNRRTS